MKTQEIQDRIAYIDDKLQAMRKVYPHASPPYKLFLSTGAKLLLAEKKTLEEKAKNTNELIDISRTV